MAERWNPWGSVRRCVVCGTKLVFLRSTKPGAKVEEGSKSCSHNHEKFQVIGRYDEQGRWKLDFHMPNLGARRNYNGL